MSAATSPVAVTGIGICSPLGRTAAEHWDGVVAGVRAVRRLTASEIGLPVTTAAAWTNWAGAPDANSLDRLPRQTDVAAELAIGVAREAFNHAGLIEIPEATRSRFGVVIGASKPPLAATTAECALGPLGQAGLWALSAPAVQVAASFGAFGPLLTPSAACATGLLSLIQGADLIRRGECDIVLAGSADWSLHAGYLAAYRRMGVLAPISEDPAASCRPFDAERSGFAVGAGAALLLLESPQHARRRGATVLAELLGAGLTSGGESLVDVDSTGEAPARALSDALRRSAISPADVDAASLHGTGTRLNDRCETAALRQALGHPAGKVSCFSLKGAIGHLMGAAGSVETATLIQAMNHQVVPATVNLERSDPECNLDYTPGQPRERRIGVAVKLSLGFGGSCAALVLRRPTG